MHSIDHRRLPEGKKLLLMKPATTPQLRLDAREESYIETRFHAPKMPTNTGSRSKDIIDANHVNVQIGCRSAYR